MNHSHTKKCHWITCRVLRLERCQAQSLAQMQCSTAVCSLTLSRVRSFRDSGLRGVCIITSRASATFINKSGVWQRPWRWRVEKRSWVPGFQTAWLKPAKGSLGALEGIRVNVLQKQCTPSIPRLPLHPHQSKDRKRWVLGEHSTHSPPERQHLQSRTRLHWGFLKGSFLVLITS